MGMLSCDKEDEKQGGSKIETLSAEKGTYMVATLSGRVSGLESVALDFECGIEYSTDKSFSDEYSTRQKVDKKYTEDSYSITVSGIQPGKKYYYRAYYINQLLIYYGEVKTFMFNMPEDVAVDLGLSVKWATFNVGASKPEEYGDYYAWGETEAKSDYSWSTYKYCNGSSSTMTKYCNDSYFGNNGFTDTKTTLDPEDDVAHVKWGGSWRMPTKTELSELSNNNNCTWHWTTQNGVNGYLVTSKKSGHEGASIFLPAAGTRYDTSLDDAGFCGYYWSSSLYTGGYPYDAWRHYFDSGYHSTHLCCRYYGRPVRPVCP